MAKASPAKAQDPNAVARGRATARRSTSEQPSRTRARPPATSRPSLPCCSARSSACRASLRPSRRRVKELEASADIDALTGIFNRRGFDRELKRSLAYVKRYWTRAALFYVDLDGFKPVNDRLRPRGRRRDPQGGRRDADAAACAPPTRSRGSAATSSA